MRNWWAILVKVDLNMEGERTKVYSASFLACHKENLRETTLKQNFFLYFKNTIFFSSPKKRTSQGLTVLLLYIGNLSKVPRCASYVSALHIFGYLNNGAKLLISYKLISNSKNWWKHIYWEFLEYDTIHSKNFYFPRILMQKLQKLYAIYVTILRIFTSQGFWWKNSRNCLFVCFIYLRPQALIEA